jgi:hypothetical protein
MKFTILSVITFLAVSIIAQDGTVSKGDQKLDLTLEKPPGGCAMKFNCK